MSRYKDITSTFFRLKKSDLLFYCIAQPDPDARKATAFDFVGVIIGIALAVSLIVAVVVAYRYWGET